MNKLSRVIVLSTLLLLGVLNAPMPPAMRAAPQADFDCTAVTEIPQTECEVLVVLYNATDGANWTNSTDWLVTDAPCNWYGVTCTAGNVSSLLLGSNQLSGTIPSEVGTLTMLQGLYLYENRLSGVIPPEIGNLTSLQTIDLNSNQLGGTVPPTITNLTALYDDGGADLGYNKLTSSDPIVLTFLNTKDPDWAATQTVPPTGLTASPSDYSVLLTWTPITYTGDGGYYEISCAEPIFGMPVSSGTTADKGSSSYLVEGLSATTYIFRVRTYTPAHGNQQNALWSEYTSWVQATPSQLEPGSISGYIFKADGSTVITDTLISVHAHGITPNSSSLGIYVSRVDGSYTIGGLAPGTYKVQANNNHAPGYVSKYYDNKYTWDLADTIEITAGQTISGINFALEPGGTIRGTVLKEGGGVITDVQLYVGAETGTGIWGSAPVSQVDGSYEISSLPDGNYRLIANYSNSLGYERKFYDNVYRWDLATPVTIAGGNTVSDIDFALGPGGGVSGHIYAEDGVTPIEGACVNVSSTAPEWNQVAGWGDTGPDGSFSFGGVLVGNVYVRTYANCRGGNMDSLDEWYADGGSVIDGNDATPIQIIAGQYTSDIDFALDPAGSISGFVFAADGSTVITDVLISVHASGITPGSSSRGTNASQVDGSYTISGLAPGTYKVQANNNRAPGYVSKYYDDKYSWDSADTIEVVAGQTTSGINFALEPGGTIRGTVLKEGGGVITDVQLYAGAGTETGIWVTAPVSQIDGSYELTGLPDGQYRVEANVDTLGYDRKYYDNVYRWDLATLVSISGGNTVAGIDFALGPGGGISGHVYAQDGVTPLEGVCLNVYSAAPMFDHLLGWGRTGSDGSFSFARVLVGNVYVRTYANCSGANLGYLDEWYAVGGSVIDRDAATAVQIVAGQLTGDINFALDLGGSISGAIYDADGSSLLNNVMYGFESTTQQGNYTTWCTGDGVFAASLPFGTYKVFAQGNSEHCGGDPNYKRKYWQEKDSWATADIITLTPELPHVTGLIFTLEPGGGISGTVYQADGVTPIANAWVYAMDSRFQYVTGSHSRADGNYLIGGLNPGNYYLAVQAEGFGGVYYPNGYDDPGAVLVPVNVPETTPNINFILSPEATLSGLVYESDGVTPISGAKVSVWPRAGGQIRSAFADSTGAYTVRGLSTGSYVARAEADGFEVEFYLNAYDWSTAMPIPVTQPNNTSGITFTLSLPSSPPPLIEKQALEALYNSTNGSQWLNHDGWMVDPNVCTWYGVTCFDGHVTRVHLNGNQLSGPIPFEIGNLTALTDLRLWTNQLSGPIPSEIGNLIALQHLYLDNNLLTGAIPLEIGNLIALRTLSLSNNQLSEVIPPEIGNLAALEWLNLANNRLTNLPQEIGNLSVLRYLILDNNNLISVPEQIGNLAALSRLWLRSNGLSNLPAEIGNLRELTGLYLGGNQLTSVPIEIRNLTKLTTLELYGNQLTNVPTEFGNLTSLEYLFLHNNPLSGEMPVLLTSLTQLYRFTFYNTDWCSPATGAVPVWLASIPSLYGTGYVCGQALGSLSGAVSLPDTSPAMGVQVNLYRSVISNQWQAVSSTQTIADGTYQFANLGQGLGIDYRVQFVDPSNQVAPQYYAAKPTISTADVITITPGVPRTGIDAVMALPKPPSVVVDPGDGSVVYNPDGTAEITMPAPTPSDITVTRAVTCSGSAIIPISVTLQLSTGPQYPMTGVGGDLYQATVPASDLTGNATLSVIAVCESGSSTTVVGYITLYDPSGIIRDTRTGLPVKGAKVTLYQVPGWLPKTGPDDTRPNTCESNLSKPVDVPWSQPAPTELGILVNAEVTPVMPKIPYQETTTEGYYGWDVSEGCWYVTVEADGYEPLVSPVVGVPPEVTDLDLELAPLAAACPIPLTGMSIAGPSSGVLDTPYTFAGTIIPIGATMPITFTWTPLPVSGQGTLTATYQWAAPGVYTVTLKAENCGGAFDAEHMIEIKPRDDFMIYLPLVVRNN